MNKQELITELKKEIEATKNVSNCEEHYSLYAKGKRVGLEFGWMFAEKLDEQELPVIPQFVADWIEDHEHLGDTSKIRVLWYAIHEVDRTIGAEMLDYFNQNARKVMRAILDGYTVEKEPRWIVSFEAKDFYPSLDNISYFKEFIEDPLIPIKPNGWSDRYDEEVYKFKEKEKAEAVALLINGTVIEVTE